MLFRPDLALRFIDEWTTYLIQFHSTVELLKSMYTAAVKVSQVEMTERRVGPPRGYMSPSVDLMHGFDKIRKRVGAGHYTSQFDFDTDVKTLLARANDGHLQAALCSLQLMHFDRGLPLVSVSEDGLQLPYIYTYRALSLTFVAAMSLLVAKLLSRRRGAQSKWRPNSIARGRDQRRGCSLLSRSEHWHSAWLPRS
jgi:hypothetical protein